jgi:uncharacterized protein
MTVTELILVGFGLSIAGLIKGITGIGFSTCALPFLVAGVGLEAAMALVTLPAIVSNLAVIVGGKDIGAVVRRFWPFYVSIVPGIFAGLAALALVGLRQAVQLLALTTIAYVGLALARPDLALPRHLERVLALPAGCLNGFFTGLTGSQIMPLMPYMMSLRLAPGEQVQAINLAVTLASSVLAAGLFWAGIMTPQFVVISALGCFPAIAGVAAGGLLQRWLSPQTFRSLALATLAMLALSLYGRQAPASSEPDACAPSTTATLALPRDALDRTLPPRPQQTPWPARALSRSPSSSVSTKEYVE